MNNSNPYNRRVLGVALKRDVFGFAVLEGPSELFSWGGRKLKPGVASYAMDKLTRLITIYEPDVIVFEDTKTSPFGRSAWVKELTTLLEQLGRDLGIETRKIPILTVKRHFGGEKTIKDDIASQLAGRFPDELGHMLPEKRTVLKNEHYRMCIFDAVAVAVASFSLQSNED